MKKIILSISLIVLTVMVTGCGSKGIIGRWKAEGFSADYYYIFNEDNTCAYEMVGAKMDCTYKDDGTKIEILYSGNTNSSTYEYKIEGNKLIIKDSLGSDVTYERQ